MLIEPGNWNLNYITFLHSSTDGDPQLVEDEIVVAVVNEPNV
jgi:hypothetical protein